jgi:hypothetical protein
VACTGVERQEVANDIVTEVSTLPERIAENPTIGGLIAIVLGSAVIVFSKSARRGFGLAAKAAVNKPIGWIQWVLSLVSSVVTKVFGGKKDSGGTS